MLSINSLFILPMILMANCLYSMQPSIATTDSRSIIGAGLQIMHIALSKTRAGLEAEIANHQTTYDERKPRVQAFNDTARIIDGLRTNTKTTITKLEINNLTIMANLLNIKRELDICMAAYMHTIQLNNTLTRRPKNITGQGLKLEHYKKYFDELNEFIAAPFIPRDITKSTEKLGMKHHTDLFLMVIEEIKKYEQEVLAASSNQTQSS